MVITGLIVTGFVVLLIAPTIHRRIKSIARLTPKRSSMSSKSSTSA